MSDIAKEILMKMRSRISTIGFSPENVYLGQEEIRRLKEWVDEIPYTCKPLTDECLRGEEPEILKFYGMRIFEVTAKSHIGFQ